MDHDNLHPSPPSLPAPSNVGGRGGCCGGCSSPSSPPPPPPPPLLPPPPILAASTPTVPPKEDTCGGSCCGEESETEEDECGCCEKKEETKEVEAVPTEETQGACEDSCCGGEEDSEQQLEAPGDGTALTSAGKELDDEDDDSLCPCCVKLVLESTGNIESSVSVASAKLLLPPNASKNNFPSNPDSSNPLERLLGRMRRCCRVLETFCKGLDCCFVPETKTRRSVPPPIISACKQVDDDEAKAEPIPSQTSTFGTHPLALEITGMDCVDCLLKVNRALSRLPSVKPVDLDYLSGLSTLAYDQEVITPEAIARYVARATGFEIKPVGRGVDKGGSTSRITLPLKFSRVPPPEILDKLNARQRTELGGFFEVSFDPQGEKARQPRDVVTELEPYGPELLPVAALEGAKDRVARDLQRIGLRTLAASVLSIPVLVLAWASLPPHPLAYGITSVILTTLIQIVGFPIISGSVRSLIYLREVDLNVLVAFSTLTAYVFSLVAFAFEVAGKPFTDPFFETVALLISLIYLGRLVQAATRKSASSAIRALQQLQSSQVVLVEQVGKEEVAERQLDSRLLHYGDVLRIRADSRLPTDGIVVSGSGEVDESSANGESLPSLKQVGSSVIAGSLNLNGSLDIQVTQLVHENSLARVTGLVRQAQSSRSRFQDVADRFAALILPIAAASAIISFVVWILVNRFGKGMSTSSSVVNAITYALSILIISCPCAIGLAVPLVVASSQRAGLREGVLFRSSEALQVAHSTNTIAFDKTGTLSQGIFSIERTEVLFAGVERIILPLVSSNTHPISKAVLSLFSTPTTSHLSSSSPPPTLEDLVSLPGMGMKATFRSYPLLGGSPTFTSTSHLPLIKDLTSLGLTLFTVTLGGELVAAIGLADVARPESAALVADLVARGKHVVVLSGDNKGAVERFARSIHLPLEDVRASCSPKDKATFISELQQQGHRVAFVGDGTNDGPALAQANLAISIGSGSEVAVAASGVVLLGDKDLQRSVLATLDLASYARQHMIASLVWCLIYFVFALLLTSGAFVRFRIEPQWAGLGEVVSVLPVVAIGLGLDARWRWRRAGGGGR